MSAKQESCWAAINTPKYGRERIDPYTVRMTKSGAMLAFSSLYGAEVASQQMKDKRVRFGRVVLEVQP
jgi:hypothetical protein